MGCAEVRKEYFEWMFDVVCKNRYAGHDLFGELLTYLHNIEFTYHMASDADRAHDGINLRHRFALLYEDDYYYIKDCLEGPCSVLEMMVALAIRCEETIMSDPRLGDRTGQWFWKMIVNLGLGAMTDDRFDEYYVKERIGIFLDRKYDADGRGGLFEVWNTDYDFRKMSIWSQMMRYLDTMI